MTAEKELQVDTSVSDEELLKDPVYVKAARTGRLKLDVCVTAICMILYFLGFLDKANLGNAKIAGLNEDLNISSTQYSVALTIFYIPYMLVELPANNVLKKVGARNLLPAFTFSFGLVCCMQGFITNYAGLLVCRVFLGLCEGGLIPCIVLYMSAFYRPSEFQLRATFLFAFAGLSGAFSGLLAAGIQQMDGIRNLPGWSWIFIIEGIFTCLFAIVAFLVLPHTIETCKWLNPTEKTALVLSFHTSGRGKESTAVFTWKEFRSAFKSPVVLLLCPIFLAHGLIVFGLAYFQPTIVGSLGYGRTETQLRSVPPYVVVFVVSLAASYFADKYSRRGIYCSIMGVLATAGYIINLTTDAGMARYGALFLCTFGGYGTAPALSAWLNDNVAPHYKRGTGIAIGFIFTQAGGIISTWIYPEEDSPAYTVGAAVSLAACVIIIICPLILWFYLYTCNKRKSKLLAESGGELPEVDIMKDTDPRYTYKY